MSSSSAPVLRERWSPSGSSRPACPCCAWSRVTGRIEPTTREPPPSGSSAPPSNGRASRASANVRPTTPSISARPTSASSISMVSAAGACSTTRQWPRMLPDDFRVRSVDGVAENWPLTYADLQPYYEATDRDFGVSGLGGNPMYPPGADPPLPPLPIGPIGLRVARAHARLGWHWWPGTNAILSAPHHGRNPCVQRGIVRIGLQRRRQGVHRCHPLAERGAQWWTSRHGSACPPHRRRRSWTCVRRGVGRPRRTRAVRSRRCRRVREQRYRNRKAPVGVRECAASRRAREFLWLGRTQPHAASPPVGRRTVRRVPRCLARARRCAHPQSSSSRTVMPHEASCAARPGRWERPGDRSGLHWRQTDAAAGGPRTTPMCVNDSDARAAGS